LSAKFFDFKFLLAVNQFCKRQSFLQGILNKITQNLIITSLEGYSSQLELPVSNKQQENLH